MNYSIRDLCWLVLVIGVALGCWRTSAQRAEERLAERIRENGYFEDRKWMAVMFPIRDSTGKFDGRMIRFWTHPHNGNNVYRQEYIFADGTSGNAYPYIGTSGARNEEPASLQNPTPGPTTDVQR